MAQVIPLFAYRDTDTGEYPFPFYLGEPITLSEAKGLRETLISTAKEMMAGRVFQRLEPSQISEESPPIIIPISLDTIDFDPDEELALGDWSQVKAACAQWAIGDYFECARLIGPLSERLGGMPVSEDDCPNGVEKWKRATALYRSGDLCISGLNFGEVFFDFCLRQAARIEGIHVGDLEDALAFYGVSL